MVKVLLPPLAVPQLDSCAFSGRAWWPRAAWHSQCGRQPLGAQPPPQVLELAASKVADFTASDHPGPALVCVTMANIATEQPPLAADGSRLRLAARQHGFAHAQAAALRHLFPLLPAEADLATAEQAFAWLASHHNLSAALEELM